MDLCLCVCRICLTREGRLYSMSKYDLYALYENLTGLKVNVDSKLPQWVCAECGLRLLSYNKLRQKSLQAHQFLLEIVDRNEYNSTDINTIIDLEAMNFKTNFIKTETDVFNNEIKIETDVEANQNKTTITDDDKFINNAETVADYEEEYLQFSDDDSELLNDNSSKQQFEEKDNVENILRQNLLHSLGIEKESFEGLNNQFDNVSSISSLTEKENYGFEKNFTMAHLNKYDSRSDLYKQRFSCENDLREHIVGTADGLQYTCSQCDFTTSVRSIAIAHGGKHVGIKHQCPHCDKEFSHHTSLLNHIRTKHPSAGDSVCELCGYSFINDRGVRHHQRQRHRGHNYNTPLEGPECVQCNITFASEAAYRLHLTVSIKHDDDNENILKSRQRVNRVTKQPITCEQCGMKCETARAYHKHFMSEHPDKTRTRYLFLVPTMCEICGRIFHNSTYLKEHLVVHKTGVNPYKCDICSKTFALKLHLQMHKKTHDKNRPLHPCQLCDKLFANKQNLNKHILIHTGEKPFECEACYKCFPTKDRMKCHYQYVHEKKPWPKRNRNRRKKDVRDTDSLIYRPLSEIDIGGTGMD